MLRNNKAATYANEVTIYLLNSKQINYTCKSVVYNISSAAAAVLCLGSESNDMWDAKQDINVTTSNNSLALVHGEAIIFTHSIIMIPQCVCFVKNMTAFNSWRVFFFYLRHLLFLACMCERQQACVIICEGFGVWGWYLEIKSKQASTVLLLPSRDLVWRWGGGVICICEKGRHGEARVMEG